MNAIPDFCNMKKWLNHNKLLLTGAIVGGVGGFIYWKFIGCNSGTCAITSNPRNSTLYFAVTGALVFSMFKKHTKDAA